jgi:hypothetical protein
MRKGKCIYKEEKKDKKLFGKIKDQMEKKIMITQNEIQKLAVDDINMNWPI